MSHNIGVRLPDSLNEALEHAARESNTSKSEIVRHYLSEAIEDATDAVPEHLREQVTREKAKQRNRHEWERTHFKSNVADKFKRAFEQGDLGNDALGRAAVESLRDIYVEDAKILFDDNSEQQEAAIEYVNAVAEHARDAADASEFDALEPSEMFSNYSGVAVGTQREGTDVARVVADANSRMNGHLTDLDAITTALSKDYGISTELARECVNYAAGRRDTIEGVEVDR